ncbi:hypothetical protein LCGC14_2320070, partial [marine sediment metagenome]
LTCRKRCRKRYGDLGADRVPPLDGMVFINDGGGGVPRWAQDKYDQMACKKGKHPKYVEGPRPQGWNEALCRIGERAAKIIENGVSRGIVLPCGED